MEKAILVKCEKTRAKICGKYKRKCFTGGCPLAKLPNFCYEQPSFWQWYRECTTQGRKQIMEVMKKLINEEE